MSVVTESSSALARATALLRDLGEHRDPTPTSYRTPTPLNQLLCKCTDLAGELARMPDPNVSISMLLACPMCGTRHIDEGEFATRSHKVHACQKCGMHWAPALVPTVGVRFLSGCKNP
jgi:hypothetical protein